MCEVGGQHEWAWEEAAICMFHAVMVNSALHEEGAERKRDLLALGKVRERQALSSRGDVSHFREALHVLFRDTQLGYFWILA